LLEVEVGWPVHQRYLALDALRGLAAIAVMFFHLGLLDDAHRLFSSAYLGVDLFFVLSGFVLARAYDERFARGLGLRSFLAIRLLRLYPTYLVGLTIGIGGYLMFGADPSSFGMVVATASSLLFIPLPVDVIRAEGLFPFNSPTWSLFFELIANGFLAIAFRSLTKRNLLLLVGGSAVGLLLVVGWHGNLYVGWEADTLVAALPRVFFSFFVGVLLARLPVRSVPRFLPEVLFLACVVVLIMPMPEYIRAVWDPVVVLVLFPSAILAISRMQLSAATAAAAQILGTLSYPLYVIHAPFFYLLKNLLTARHAPPPVGLGLIALLMVLPLSYLLGAFFERPVANFLRSRPETGGRA